MWSFGNLLHFCMTHSSIFLFYLAFFFLSTLLRYNLYTIRWKYFKCTVEFWQIILLSHHCPIQGVQFPSSKKVPLCHLAVSPIPYCRIALIWQNFIYKWDHWLCISFLAFFTHHVLEIHLSTAPFYLSYYFVHPYYFPQIMWICEC